MSLADSVDLLRDTQVEFTVDGLTVMILISQIQLALRHPRNNGHSADIAKQLAISLQNKIHGIDATVDLTLEMGWNPDYDDY